MYTYSIIILKIARKINRNVEFPGFLKLSIRLSVNPHWKLRIKKVLFFPLFRPEKVLLFPLFRPEKV